MCPRSGRPLAARCGPSRSHRPRTPPHRPPPGPPRPGPRGAQPPRRAQGRAAGRRAGWRWRPQDDGRRARPDRPGGCATSCGSPDRADRPGSRRGCAGRYLPTIDRRHQMLGPGPLQHGRWCRDPGGPDHHREDPRTVRARPLAWNALAVARLCGTRLPLLRSGAAASLIVRFRRARPGQLRDESSAGPVARTRPARRDELRSRGAREPGGPFPALPRRGPAADRGLSEEPARLPGRRRRSGHPFRLFGGHLRWIDQCPKGDHRSLPAFVRRWVCGLRRETHLRKSWTSLPADPVSVWRAPADGSRRDPRPWGLPPGALPGARGSSIGPAGSLAGATAGRLTKRRPCRVHPIHRP